MYKRQLGGPDAAYRVTLALTQLTGLAIARHVVGAEAIAGTGDEDLVASVGPVVQHYLTGPLTGPVPNALPSDLPPGRS